MWAHIVVKPTALDFTYHYKILYMCQGPYEILMNIMQSCHTTVTISTFDRVLFGNEKPCLVVYIYKFDWTGALYGWT